MNRSAKDLGSARGLLAHASVIVMVASLVLLGACGAERQEYSSSRQVKEVVTTPFPPMTDISITNLHDVPAGDPSSETVVGTITNHGDRAVSQLSIRVDALDGTGRVVNSVTTPPLAETIQANGGQAQFSAQMAKNPAVTTYHAVAIAR